MPKAIRKGAAKGMGTVDRGCLPQAKYFTTHDHERMAFFTMGDERCPAVVLLHGFRNSSRCWFRKGARFTCQLAVQLAEAGYYAVALDLRGHGQSASPTDPAKYI